MVLPHVEITTSNKVKKYKATLYYSKECLTKGVITEPIDTVLLNKKCYQTAEVYFFDDGRWDRSEALHIEIESEPRVIDP